MQGIIKKCYVHLERLPEHMIKKCSVKIDMKYLSSSEETLKLDEIKIEEFEDLDGNIYNDNVSLFCLWLLKKNYVMNIGRFIYLQTVLNSSIYRQLSRSTVRYRMCDKM